MHIPASLAGLPPQLEIGAPADFCLLNMTEGNLLEDLHLYLDGERVV